MQENEVKNAVNTALRELKEYGSTSFGGDIEVNLEEMARELGQSIYRWEGDEKGEYNLFTFDMVIERYINDYIPNYYIEALEGEDDKDKPMSINQFANDWYVRY